MALISKSGTPSLASPIPTGGDVLRGLKAGEAIAAGDVIYVASDGTVMRSNGTAANAAAVGGWIAAGDAQIGEAIMRTLAPTTQIKSSPEARFEQIHNTLKASRQAGYSHLLVIEEAHCLPKATLKHLKRFTELKQGLSRLLGVALIGQPELRVKLSDQNPDVREVVQRCELVELPPLDNELEAYIQHKLSRAGAEASAIFEPDSYDAIRARLIRMPRGGRPSDAVSVCYPLVVNNLVTRAMNAAASVGMAKVDASVIAGC